MAEPTLVMRGLLREFRLADVLQVVGMSRQLTSIELRCAEGKVCGMIWLKAGRVVAAQTTTTAGKDAFFELFGPDPAWFVVSRFPDRDSYADPLGPLGMLLVDAMRRAPGSAVGPLPAEPPAGGTSSVAPPRPRQARGSEPGVAAVAAEPRPVRPPPPPPARGARTTVPPRAPIAAPLPSALHTTIDTRPPVMDDPAVSGPGGAGFGAAIAIASPKGGVGKTTIALNLATSLAERGLRVVLVEADVNGDLLSLLDARGRVRYGALDVVDAIDLLDDAVRDTAMANLRMLPAVGRELPAGLLERRDLADGWRRVVRRLRASADVVLVDCPAGMFDVTRDVLAACSHVVGVCQADLVAERSFEMFRRALATIPGDRRPELAGVVVNMFQGRQRASMEAFHHLCDDDRHRLFETTIPRSEAFSTATCAGQPLKLVSGEDASPVAWLFDSLAAELCARASLLPAEASVVRPFLV